jgi:phosphatidylserine synthase
MSKTRQKKQESVKKGAIPANQPISGTPFRNSNFSTVIFYSRFLSIALAFTIQALYAFQIIQKSSILTPPQIIISIILAFLLSLRLYERIQYPGLTKGSYLIEFELGILLLSSCYIIILTLGGTESSPQALLYLTLLLYTAYAPLKYLWQ